jgi:hypothetical protein
VLTESAMIILILTSLEFGTFNVRYWHKADIALTAGFDHTASPPKLNAFLFTELTKFLDGVTSAQIFLAKQCKH